MFIRRAKLWIVLTSLLAAVPVPAHAAGRPVVVATTTMIRSMVELLAPSGIECRNLIPPAACPGQFDLKPRDAAGLAGASLIIRHDYQAYLDSRLRAQNPDLKILVLRTPGHLVVPENYLAALGLVKEMLAGQFPELSAELESGYASARGRIAQAEAEAHQTIRRDNLARTRAVCSEMQSGFLLWAGVQVCAVFSNSPDELSVQRLRQIIALARGKDAGFVAGSLQSGGEPVARGIASELGLPVCILSNFPGTSERNRTYFDLLRDNLALLSRAASGTSHP
jgi:zinc transport system substrate-binding protein